MIGYPIPERETCCMLFISEAMAFLLLLSISSSVILSFVPTYCNQLSPIRLADGPPFSPERSYVLQTFLLSAFTFLAFIRRHSALFLQSLRIARSRESVQDSCRPMSLGSYRPANLMIRTDSKHSLRLFDMSFFLITRLLNARICLFRTDSKQGLRPFVFI